MGMELVGYLVKGPTEPDFGDDNKSRFLKVIENLREWAWSVNRGDPIQLGHWELKYTDVDQYCDTDELMVIDGDLLWDNLRGLWSNGSRDCQSRLDPINKRHTIMFCGDMTWGEPPEGMGYETLKWAHKTGLLEILKIR